MSLSDLPTELIVLIFKSVDKSRSAAALSCTSRRLHKIWLYNLPSICDAILSGTVECYDKACHLLQARKKSSTVTRVCSAEEKAKAAAARGKVLLSNAEMVDWALRQFEIELTSEWDLEPRSGITGPSSYPGTEKDCDGLLKLQPRNRVRFLQGYYRAMILMFFTGKSETRLRYQVLASMRLLDFFRMLEVVEWIVYDMEVSQILYEDTVLCACDIANHFAEEELWKGSYEECLEDGLKFLEAVETDILGITGVAFRRPVNDIFLYHSPIYPLILREDCWPDKANKAKGISLAKLLPMLPKSSSLYPGHELSAPH